MGSHCAGERRPHSQLPHGARRQRQDIRRARPYIASLCDRARRLSADRALRSARLTRAYVSVVLNREALIVSLAMPELPMGDVSRSIWLWGLTNLALLPKRLAGAGDKPKEILCMAPAPRPAELRVLRDQFPFKFGVPESRVVFDRRVGELAISTADADLRSLLAETMDRHLATLGPAASFEEAVLTVLRSMMNGNMPTLASLSRCSGMSQRTLQRRLSESHTSFQRLLRQVLHETSDKLLARETLSHGEIAFLLGYSEESAFSRAYKSWTGHPPGSTHLRRTVQHHL